MKQLKLQVVARDTTGRRNASRMRRGGRIPAVVYGRSGSRSVSVQEREFRMMMRAAAGSAVLINIAEESATPVLAVLQEIQRHAVTDEFMHIDFREVCKDQSIAVEVPVHLVGEPIGVQTQGGLLEAHLHQIAIKCLPFELPNAIEVDVSALAVGDAIHIKDLPVIAGVTFSGEPEAVVASCSEPSSTKAAAGAMAATEEETDQAESADEDQQENN